MYHHHILTDPPFREKKNEMYSISKERETENGRTDTAKKFTMRLLLYIHLHLLFVCYLLFAIRLEIPIFTLMNAPYTSNTLYDEH